MIKIKTLKLGALETNCYLVWDDQSRETIVIDPADEADFILQELTKLNLNPKYILATHGHFDHNLASLELVLSLEIPFAASAKDQFLFDRIAQSATHWLKLKNEPTLQAPPITVLLKNNQEIKLGARSFKIIETPGHTPGSICLFAPEQKILFSGDTLFAQAVGRTDFKYGSASELKKSLKKIFTLPPETAVYPGHGNTTTLKEEKINCRQMGFI